jgi:signal transduction histidine kinase/ActR/RegA family two-component response regulator
LESLNILIVEDNPGDVFLITQLLKSAGIQFNHTNVSTLKETLLVCEEQQFDIILLDLGLPDSMGLETLKSIYAFNPKVPLVVMTGFDDEYTALTALREGAQDYLVKNRLNPDSVLRSIKFSIERKKIHLLQKLYAQRFTILSAATAALNECDDIPSVFRIICANIMNLLEKAGAMAIEFPENDHLRVSGIEWLQPRFDEIREVTGWDLNDPVFPVNDKVRSLFNNFDGSSLYKIADGLPGLFKGVLSREKCDYLENLFHYHNVYAIGFYQHSIFYGGFLIFSHDIICKDDINIIETISNQTSLNIHRRFIEKNLRISEDMYKSLNIQLENKVKERTYDLEVANSQLLELNATKDKFFNIVAHDLKNPFTSLLGSSELLFQNIDLLDRDDIRKLSLLLNDSAKSGYAILQNLLDWSRSQTGLLKINPEKFNLKQLIDENISNMELFWSNKEIQIVSEVSSDIYIYADKNMIETVLRNLISNSLKFSYRSGKVIVKAIINQEEIIISVKDFGTGIPCEEIEKLFRIDTKFSLPGTENEQGTGLGLKLCKEFVEMQNGRIWVESEDGKGSEFSFSIANKNGNGS